ncbi:MAG TPA: hypothetical protein VG165_03760 [Solirubrobacteraceae bacterium]|nr:hypothetical protein [Solirubrobacteraceae bacterium]
MDCRVDRRHPTASMEITKTPMNESRSGVADNVSRAVLENESPGPKNLGGNVATYTADSSRTR